MNYTDLMTALHGGYDQYRDVSAAPVLVVGSKYVGGDDGDDDADANVTEFLKQFKRPRKTGGADESESDSDSENESESEGESNGESETTLQEVAIVDASSSEAEDLDEYVLSESAIVAESDEEQSQEPKLEESYALEASAVVGEAEESEADADNISPEESDEPEPELPVDGAAEDFSKVNDILKKYGDYIE